ncbi:MAG: septation protein A [Rugosibacter sp.]|jgi:intracellular septation protein|nr:septation protein A [Rugosibacter sp.]MDO9272558.1 septation protein A [Rugosibacter sp.]
MKFLFDLFPVILFFASFKIAENQPQAAADLVSQIFGLLGSDALITDKQAPILLSTMVVILATVLQIAWVWFRHRKVDTMLWVSLVLVTVFGSATLIFHDETFIKWKPTILYWIFAATLLGSSQFLGRNLIYTMLEKQMQLPTFLWARLNYAWAAFFTAMGVLNLYVAFNFSTAIWVNFKLFGGMGLMFLFIIGQGLLLAKYMPQENS